MLAPNARGRWRTRIDPLGIVGLAIAFAVWAFLSSVMPPSQVPSPWGVVRAAGTDFFGGQDLSYYGLADSSLFGNLLYTMENVCLALVIGTAIGGVLGLITARFELARALIDPIVLTAGTIPVLIITPFLLVWFGVSRLSAVLVVVFYIAVIIYVYAQQAADNLDPVFEDSARTLGATPRSILTSILLPGTLPEIMGGIRIALAGSWGLEAIAELMGAQQGIGKIIESLAGSTDAEGIFAALFVLGAAAAIVDALVAAGIRRLTTWHRSAHDVIAHA
jgi:ABC-type nitrate/sulfonate/bicarbonate transport system permease component